MAKFFWDHMNIKPSFIPERLCPLQEALEWQDWYFSLIEDDIQPKYNFIIFAEHDHIYTYDPDKEGKPLVRNEKDPNGNSLPAPLVPLKRGGSVTYHGPGQLVCYLIIDLDDAGIAGPGVLTEVVDDIVKEALSRFSIKGYTTKELCAIEDKDIENQLFAQGIIQRDKQERKKDVMAAQGIWVITKEKKCKKIASRGLYIPVNKSQETAGKRIYITKFGFALNVTTDLSYFAHIYPCGLDIQMTSIKEQTGKTPKLPQVAKLVAEIAIEKFKKRKKASE